MTPVTDPELLRLLGSTVPGPATGMPLPADITSGIKLQQMDAPPVPASEQYQAPAPTQAQFDADLAGVAARKAQAMPMAPGPEGGGFGLIGSAQAAAPLRPVADPALLQLLNADIDTKTGAPAVVRHEVGGAPEKDRLATLQQRYPDARPYGPDNFVFTDPGTGRPTLYKQDRRKLFGVPLPSLGDAASVMPEAAEYLGGTFGAGLAAMSAPATGGMGALAMPLGYGLGAAGGREAENLLARVLTKRQDTRPIVEKIGDAGVTAGVNAMGGRAAELIGQGVRAVAGPVVNYGRNALMRPGTQAIQDFANAGVLPGAGAATGNRAMQMIEKGLGNTPGGSRPIQDQAQRQIAEVRTAADELAQRFATGAGAAQTGARGAAGIPNPGGQIMTKEGAGRIAAEGGERASARFAARVAGLENDMYQAVGPQRRVNATNVQNVVQDFQGRVQRDPQLEPVYRQIIRDFGNAGDMSFQALHRLRMRIGQAMPAPDASDYRGASGQELSRLYGALRDDMSAAAQQAGPRAVAAMDRADRYIRLNQNVNMPVLNALDRTASDEAAWNWAMSASKDGGSRLRALRRNLEPAEWDAIAGSALNRLGAGTAGASGPEAEFSVARFLTNWRAMSPEARDALFGGTRYARIQPDLNTLVRVIDRLKDTEKMANPSGTARNLIIGTLVGTAGTQAFSGHPGEAAATVAGAVIAPRLAANLITNPRFVRWIAGVASAPSNPTGGWAGQLARLAAIGEAEPSIRAEVHQFLDALRNPPAGPPQPVPATATATQPVAGSTP